MRNNNNYNKRNKVNYLWVLVSLIICVSMAYAGVSYGKTVMQFNKEQDLEKIDQSLRFPVLEHWDAGNGENAIWVDPRQNLNAINLPGISFNTPEYKLSLNSRQPETNMVDPNRIYRGVAKIKLYSWFD